MMNQLMALEDLWMKKIQDAKKVEVQNLINLPDSNSSKTSTSDSSST